MRLSIAEVRPFPMLAADSRATLEELARTAARLALGGLIVLSPFRARLLLDARPITPVYGDYTNFLLFWSDIALIAVLSFWALSLLLKQRPLWLGPVLVRGPVALLLLFVWLSVPFSVDVSLSAYNALRVTGAVALLLYLVNELESVAQVVPAVASMVALQAVVGIAQVLDQTSVGLFRFGELHLDPAVRGASIVWTADSPVVLRAYGLADHPNLLGGLLAIALLVVGAGLSRGRTLWSVLLSAVFAAGALALLLTFSRSAALALIAGLGVVFLLLAYRRNGASAGLWLGACLAAALFCAPFLNTYAPYLGTRANPESTPAGSPEDRSLSERAALAKNANELFIRNPILGVGIGALPEAMDEAYPDFEYNYQPAHFVLLDVATELGLIGAFAYGIMLVGPWVLLWLHRRELTAELIGMSGAIFAVDVIGLFDYYTWSLAPGRIWVWLVLGLWVVAYRRALDGSSDA